MTEQLPCRNDSGFGWELGHIRTDVGIDVHPTTLPLLHHRKRRERLGNRRPPEPCVRGNGRGRLAIRPSPRTQKNIGMIEASFYSCYLWNGIIQ